METKKLQLNVFNVLGKEVSKIEVSSEVFGIEPHNQSMFDLILSERSALRQGNHSTKNRSDVSGGGKKPWRQKGTGRARQGSIRSPQWRGGGIVFGPTPLKNYSLKVNKKIRRLAFKSGISYSVKNDKIIVIDNIEFNNPSTKDFFKMLNNFKTENKKVLLIMDFAKEENHKTFLSARNIKNVTIEDQRNFSLDNILKNKKIIMTQDTLKFIEGRFS